MTVQPDGSFEYEKNIEIDAEISHEGGWRPFKKGWLADKVPATPPFAGSFTLNKTNVEVNANVTFPDGVSLVNGKITLGDPGFTLGLHVSYDRQDAAIYGIPLMNGHGHCLAVDTENLVYMSKECKTKELRQQWRFGQRTDFSVFNQEVENKDRKMQKMGVLINSHSGECLSIEQKKGYMTCERRSRQRSCLFPPLAACCLPQPVYATAHCR